MTKRRLYALAGRGVSVLTLWAAAHGGQALYAAGGQNAVCAACLAIVIPDDAAAALPAELGGLEVFVALAPGRDARVAAAMSDIAQRGGRPSLVVDARIDLPDATLLAQARRVLVVDSTGSAAPPDPDAAAFALKTRVTAIRAAAAPTVTIGLAGDDRMLQAALEREIGSYVDFLVTSDAGPGVAAGLDRWRQVPAEVTSLQAALELTRTVGTTNWLWMLPSNRDAVAALAAELTRAAALPVPGAPAPADAPGGFVEGIEVVGARSLTVEEIVARHQAAAARQATVVRTVIARGTLTLSFEAPGFPAPITIGSDTTILTTPQTTEIEQRSIRINGLAFRGSAVPRLPIIEPERVASAPLVIALTDVYRYRLAGRETIDGTPCYVVAFEPDPARADKQATLFRGHAWIAAESFAMRKVSAAQTSLRGPIVASEQTDEFGEAAPGIWLLVRSDVRQMYEGAAHRTPIHRVLAIESNEINAPDFDARQRRAYASDSVMLRDTPQGYRYLRRTAQPAAEAPTVAIAGRADRVRTIAGGVIVDPNISFPLPFAGISYVDFNVLDTGTQINGFFGGTYGQFALSVPSVAGSRWQFAARGFAIASSFNDRAFVAGRERYEENIRQRPAQAALWVLRPLTPRLALRLEYDLDYTHLTAGDATAPDFVVPADQLVHGARVSIDLQRLGWNGSVWWNPARRTGWREWGRPGSGDYRPSHADFQRYGVSVARSRVISAAVALRIEGAWMSGRDLDRFSRYSFGTFDNRLHGYPSALIRYDRGGVVRTALAWSARSIVRVDGFIDSAAVHDPGFGRGLRNYTGLGAAVEAPAPFGTLVAVEWGYGLRGVNGDGSRGTQVLRVSGYKVF